MVALYSLRWVIELLFKLLKSSCHLDHVDTANPAALRTHIYASLLAATILMALTITAAAHAGIPASSISPLVAGIAAPMLAIPLLILWCQSGITREKLAAAIVRALVLGCVDQNPARTRKKWGRLTQPPYNAAVS